MDGEIPDTTTTDGATSNDGGQLPTDASPFDAGQLCGGSGGKLCYGGECVSNKCQPYQLTTTSVSAGAIATDGTYAYFLSGSDTVDRIDEDHNLTPMITGEENLTSIAVANDNVYFANSTIGGTEGRITSCSTSGCGTSGINRVDLLKNAKHSIQGLAVTSTALWYADDDASGTTTAGGIHMCALTANSCNATPFVSDSLANDVQISGSSLYWLGGSTNMGQNGVFNSSATTPSINGTANAGIIDFAITTSELYLLTLSGVSHEPLAGGSAISLISSQISDQAIATDNSSLYWLDNRGTDDGVLEQCTLGTGGTCESSTPTTIASALNAPHHLALAGNFIYFTTDDGVFRLVK